MDFMFSIIYQFIYCKSHLSKGAARHVCLALSTRQKAISSLTIALLCINFCLSTVYLSLISLFSLKAKLKDLCIDEENVLSDISEF